MSAWSEEHLSSAGKEVQIKSVAQAIPTYLMSVFQLPAGLCEELERGIRNFWWGAEKGQRTHWIAWDKFTRSKDRGGLGFRDFKIFNQALLARQAWRLIAFPESLCARLLKARYFPNGDLLTAFPSAVSPTWRAIMFGLELLKKGAIWRVGNGKQIKIWSHAWIPKPFSLRPAGSTRPCRLKWVHQLIDAEARCWKEDVLKRFFFQFDVDEILKLHIPWRDSEDVVAWHYEKSGIFSVRSAYRLGISLEKLEVGTVSSSSIPDGGRPAWKKLWKLPVPHKVRIFAWKLANGGLATKRNKMRRKITREATCDLCGREEESEFHAVISCDHASHLRKAMRDSWVLRQKPCCVSLARIGSFSSLTE